MNSDRSLLHTQCHGDLCEFDPKEIARNAEIFDSKSHLYQTDGMGYFSKRDKAGVIMGRLSLPPKNTDAGTSSTGFICGRKSQKKKDACAKPAGSDNKKAQKELSPAQIALEAAIVFLSKGLKTEALTVLGKIKTIRIEGASYFFNHAKASAYSAGMGWSVPSPIEGTDYCSRLAQLRSHVWADLRDNLNYPEDLHRIETEHVWLMDLKRVQTKRYLSFIKTHCNPSIPKARIEDNRTLDRFSNYLKVDKIGRDLLSKFSDKLDKVSSKVSGCKYFYGNWKYPTDEQTKARQIKTRLAFLAIFWPTTLPQLSDKRHCSLLYQAGNFYGVGIEMLHNKIMLDMNLESSLFQDFMIPFPDDVKFDLCVPNEDCNRPLDIIPDERSVQQNVSSSSSNRNKEPHFNGGDFLRKRSIPSGQAPDSGNSKESNNSATTNNIKQRTVLKEDRLIENKRDLFGNKYPSFRHSEMGRDDDSTCGDC